MSYLDTIDMTDAARKRITMYFPALTDDAKQELTNRIQEYYNKYYSVTHQILNLGDIERILSNE